jgi:seryl-tRNA synthetase
MGGRSPIAEGDLVKKLDYKLLSDSEKQLVLDARPKQLRKLDEDELIDLHKRMRRARNKYAKLYRRRAAGQVGADRSRSKASKKHARVAAKAEIFEDKLSKVSRQLAVVSRERAETLRDERLAAARGEAVPSGRRRTPRDHRKGDKNGRGRDKRSIERRNVASSRAIKARKGAKAGR